MFSAFARYAVVKQVADIAVADRWHDSEVISRHFFRYSAKEQARLWFGYGTPGRRFVVRPYKEVREHDW